MPPPCETAEVQPGIGGQGGGAGVAMHNIADRIARFYGPRSSTQVISSPGAGTSVVLHLDLQKSILE